MDAKRTLNIWETNISVHVCNTFCPCALNVAVKELDDSREQACWKKDEPKESDGRESGTKWRVVYVILQVHFEHVCACKKV